MGCRIAIAQHNIGTFSYGELSLVMCSLVGTVHGFDFDFDFDEILYNVSFWK